MSNPNTFMNNYVTGVQNLTNALDAMQHLNNVLVADATLVTRYFAQPTGQFRTDIVAADVTNASSAVGQLLFAFNSGSPTQASYLYKIYP